MQPFTATRCPTNVKPCKALACCMCTNQECQHVSSSTRSLQTPCRGARNVDAKSRLPRCTNAEVLWHCARQLQVLPSDDVMLDAVAVCIGVTRALCSPCTHCCVLHTNKHTPCSYICDGASSATFALVHKSLPISLGDKQVKNTFQAGDIDDYLHTEL